MPQIYRLRNGYIVTVWSDEEREPIHVHVSRRRPSENATKFWLYSDGIFHLAHNKSRIPPSDLRYIEDFLNANAESIRDFWIGYHGYEKYYK